MGLCVLSQRIQTLFWFSCLFSPIQVYLSKKEVECCPRAEVYHCVPILSLLPGLPCDGRHKADCLPGSPASSWLRVKCLGDGLWWIRAAPGLVKQCTWCCLLRQGLGKTLMFAGVASCQPACSLPGLQLWACTASRSCVAPASAGGELAQPLSFPAAGGRWVKLGWGQPSHRLAPHLLLGQLLAWGSRSTLERGS